MCAVDSECTQNRQVRESVLIDLTIKSARHLVVDPSATVDLGLRSSAEQARCLDIEVSHRALLLPRIGRT